MSDGSSVNPFKYLGRIGYYFDQDAIQYFVRARFYDPAVGRFRNVDPLGFAAGDLNLFRYVNSNPVNLTDPSGTVVPFIIGGAIAAWAVFSGGCSKPSDSDPSFCECVKKVSFHQYHDGKKYEYEPDWHENGQAFAGHDFQILVDLIYSRRNGSDRRVELFWMEKTTFPVTFQKPFGLWTLPADGKFHDLYLGSSMNISPTFSDYKARKLGRNQVISLKDQPRLLKSAGRNDTRTLSLEIRFSNPRGCQCAHKEWTAKMEQFLELKNGEPTKGCKFAISQDFKATDW